MSEVNIRVKLELKNKWEIVSSDPLKSGTATFLYVETPLEVARVTASFIVANSKPVVSSNGLLVIDETTSIKRVWKFDISQAVQESPNMELDISINGYDSDSFIPITSTGYFKHWVKNGNSNFRFLNPDEAVKLEAYIMEVSAKLDTKLDKDPIKAGHNQRIGLSPTDKTYIFRYDDNGDIVNEYTSIAEIAALSDGRYQRRYETVDVFIVDIPNIPLNTRVLIVGQSVYGPMALLERVRIQDGNFSDFHFIESVSTNDQIEARVESLENWQTVVDTKVAPLDYDTDVQDGLLTINSNATINKGLTVKGDITMTDSNVDLSEGTITAKSATIESITSTDVTADKLMIGETNVGTALTNINSAILRIDNRNSDQDSAITKAQTTATSALNKANANETAFNNFVNPSATQNTPLKRSDVKTVKQNINLDIFPYSTGYINTMIEGKMLTEMAFIKNGITYTVPKGKGLILGDGTKLTNTSEGYRLDVEGGGTSGGTFGILGEATIGLDYSPSKVITANTGTSTVGSTATKLNRRVLSTTDSSVFKINNGNTVVDLTNLTGARWGLNTYNMRYKANIANANTQTCRMWYYILDNGTVVFSDEVGLTPNSLDTFSITIPAYPLADGSIHELELKVDFMSNNAGNTLEILEESSGTIQVWSVKPMDLSVYMTSSYYANKSIDATGNAVSAINSEFVTDTIFPYAEAGTDFFEQEISQGTAPTRGTKATLNIIKKFGDLSNLLDKDGNRIATLTEMASYWRTQIIAQDLEIKSIQNNKVGYTNNKIQSTSNAIVSRDLLDDKVKVLGTVSNYTTQIDANLLDSWKPICDAYNDDQIDITFTPGINELNVKLTNVTNYNPAITVDNSTVSTVFRVNQGYSYKETIQAIMEMLDKPSTGSTKFYLRLYEKLSGGSANKIREVELTLGGGADVIELQDYILQPGNEYFITVYRNSNVGSETITVRGRSLLFFCQNNKGIAIDKATNLYNEAGTYRSTVKADGSIVKVQTSNNAELELFDTLGNARASRDLVDASGNSIVVWKQLYRARWNSGHSTSVECITIPRNGSTSTDMYEFKISGRQFSNDTSQKEYRLFVGRSLSSTSNTVTVRFIDESPSKISRDMYCYVDNTDNNNTKIYLPMTDGTTLSTSGAINIEYRKSYISSADNAMNIEPIVSVVDVGSTVYPTSGFGVLQPRYNADGIFRSWPALPHPTLNKPMSSSDFAGLTFLETIALVYDALPNNSKFEYQTVDSSVDAFRVNLVNGGLANSYGVFTAIKAHVGGNTSNKPFICKFDLADASAIQSYILSYRATSTTSLRWKQVATTDGTVAGLKNANGTTASLLDNGLIYTTDLTAETKNTVMSKTLTTLDDATDAVQPTRKAGMTIIKYR